MSAEEQLKSILNEQYISEDGDSYSVELKPGLSQERIENLAKLFPSGKIPIDIIDLLKFASGFEFYGLEEISFDNIGQFGFEGFFPNAVQLAGDGFGNFWILDIDRYGNWGSVFYVCHDPAVIVKHSDNLTQFIKHVHEFGKNGSRSNLDIIHEKVVIDIWERNHGLIELEKAKQSDDIILKEFAWSLPKEFVIADLRNKPIQNGFAWGKSNSNPDKTMRHKKELIWGIEKPAKRGFLSGIFGKR